MTARTGLLVRAGAEQGFVPATIAREVVPQPRQSSVAGTPLEMAVVGGRIVPVIALGSAKSALLVCELDGELLGFSGLEVECVGSFEAADGGVLVGDRTVRDLPLGAALRSLERALTPRIGASS
jgi:hypothetical protein